MMIKGSVLQEAVTILNIYAAKNSVKICEVKQIELQGKTDKSTIIVGDFNTPLSVIDRSSRQKIARLQLIRTAPSINWI